MSKKKKKEEKVNAIQGTVSKGINAELEPVQKPWLQQQGNSAAEGAHFLHFLSVAQRSTKRKRMIS